MPVDTQVAEPVVESTATTPVIDPKVDDPSLPVATTEPPDSSTAPEADAPVEDASEPDIEEASPESGNFSKFKHLFKDNPELRAIVGREAALSELYPTFSEAKQIRELIPTLEDAEKIVENSRALTQLSDDFRTNPSAYLDTLKHTDEYAFSKLVNALPAYLENDEQAYLGVARPIINNLFDNLHKQSQGNADFQAHLTAVAQSLGINLGAYRAATPVNSEVDRLKAQLSEREQRDRTAQVETFFQSADSEFSERTIGDIDKALAKTGFSDRIKDTIKREVWDATNEEMKSQPQTMAYINQARARASQGRSSSSELRDLVNFTYKRLAPVTARLLKDQISTWSKEVSTKAQVDLAKKQTVAATTATIPAQTRPPVATPTPPAQRQSVDDVLAAARARAGIAR